MSIKGLLQAGLLLTVTAAAMNAAPITIVRDLTTGQEIPPPTITMGSNPRGTASATLDLDAGTLSAMLNWADMTSNVTAAHIHRINPAAATPGTGGVVVGFFMGVSFPPTGNFNTASPITLTPTQINSLRAGLSAGDLYFNVHTVTNPPGEIRGNIGVVPEPGTYALLASGLGGLWLLRKRSRK